MDKYEELRLNTLMQVLQQQRDQAQLQVGQMAGEIAVLRLRLEEAEKAANAPKETEVMRQSDAAMGAFQITQD